MQRTSAIRQDPLSIGDARVHVRDGAKALVSRAGEVLLVKETHADGSPFWTLPGGGIAAGETAVEGLQRELEEEMRTRAMIHEPVTTFVYKHRSRRDTLSRYTVYDCSLDSDPEPNPREGILAHRWIDPMDPPGPTLPQVRWVLAGLGNE